jgi:hypothetical protein
MFRNAKNLWHTVYTVQKYRRFLTSSYPEILTSASLYPQSLPEDRPVKEGRAKRQALLMCLSFPLTFVVARATVMDQSMQ